MITRQPVTQSAMPYRPARLDMVRLEADLRRSEVCAEMFSAIARRVRRFGSRNGKRCN